MYKILIISAVLEFHYKAIIFPLYAVKTQKIIYLCTDSEADV